MYSLVLLTALAAGGDAPAFWHCEGYYGSWGCEGCFGCWGSHTGPTCHGAFGGNGGHGCQCYPSGGQAATANGAKTSTTPASSTGTTTDPSKPLKRMKPADDSGASEKDDATGRVGPARPARLIVELPENARLFVDDQPLANQSARRSFRTPNLQEGQIYYYSVRAEIVRDGTTYHQTKRVLLRAGEEIRTSFRDLEKTITAQVDASGSR